MTFTELAPAASDPPEPFTDRLRLAVAAYLARFKGSSRAHTPCGSGTCARLAVLAADGRLPAGTVLRHESIIGTTFTGTVLATVDAGGRPAILPQVV